LLKILKDAQKLFKVSKPQTKQKKSHPQVYYTSRLNFNNLPEPENDSQSLSQNLLEFTIPDDVDYEEGKL